MGQVQGLFCRFESGEDRKVKNGDVMDFLERMDLNEWDVLYKGYGYLFQCNYIPERKTFYVSIIKMRGHKSKNGGLVYEYDSKGDPIDYSYIDLPEFKTYQEAIKDFVQERIWDNNTKTFWEVQDEMEWL